MDLDFSFAFEGAAGSSGPFTHLWVVDFRGHEEMSALYRYELTLFARAPSPEVDPLELVGKRATLRLRTHSVPEFHVVHGIVAEAEETHVVADGVLYRVVLVPPLTRALYRRRCRIFLEKTTRQIIDAVLQADPLLTKDDGATVEAADGTPAWSAAAEKYAWRIMASPRIDQPSARPYCVQYNESDLAFVSRLLEEEGIAYHYENGDGACLLVLSDGDEGRSKLAAPIGLGLEGRQVSVLRLGGRLRAKSVSLDDYNWHKPKLSMLARAGDGDPVEYSYPGGYPDAPAQGEPLAKAIVDRYAVEASYAVGEGHCHFLFAGAIAPVLFPRPSHEGEYLVTKLDVRGEQRGVHQHLGAGGEHVPFHCRFEAARREGGTSRFRPARVTPRPRIHGSQTAFVTVAPEAPGAPLLVGDLVGCVRLRFHWDHDEDRLAKEPSSCWVRVSQAFAGGGEGGVWHPRSGVEVIVEFLEGDPDRPIVTGRVYNGAMTPPAPATGSPTISTWKSFSIPGGAQYNEIAYDDAAGTEQIKMHAAKDWNTVVEHDRTELAKNDSTSTIGVDRTESTGNDRSTSVGVNNTEMVGANETVAVGANQTLTVGVNQSVAVGNDQSTSIGGKQTITIVGDQAIGITKGNQTLEVATGLQHFTIQGKQDFDVTGNIEYQSKADVAVDAANNMSLTAGELFRVQAHEHRYIASGGSEKIGFGCRELDVVASESVGIEGTQKIALKSQAIAAEGTDTLGLKGKTITVDGVTITVQGDKVTIHGASNVEVSAGTELVLSGGGSGIKLNGGGVEVSGSSVKVSGGSVDISGGIVKIN